MSTVSRLWRSYFGNAEEKRRESERDVKRVAQKHNVYMYPIRTGWVEDAVFQRARTRNIVGIPDPSCFVLQSVMRSLAPVDGDVAECGVRFGKSTTFMREADARQRSYHLFDSFDGLSEPTAQDALPSGEAAWKRGDIRAAEEIARSNLSSYPGMTIYKGWIPDRFSEVADRTFALLHVDVDLYEPTKDSLDFFWPRLSPRGVVVCDDYGSLNCPGARQAVDEFLAGKEASLVELPTQQALIVKFG